jgi:hypothetical protein
MKTSFLPIFAIIVLTVGGITTFVGETINFSVLYHLLNDNPYDPIETHSLVSPAIDLIFAIVFIPPSLFLLLKGILNATRERHTIASAYGIASIALFLLQLFYYSATTAHYG